MGSQAWQLEEVAIGLGGETANSLADRINSIQSAVGGGDSNSHIPLYTGDIYYIDAAQADDTGDGKSPENAKKTIGAGIGLLSPGDALAIKAGTYTEVGIDLNVQACELWFEIGTIIAPASGTGLTISAAYCKLECPNGSLRINPAANETGLEIQNTAGFCYINDVRVAANSSADIGFDIIGNGTVLNNCRCSAPLVAAFKIQGDKIKLDGCCTGGEVANVSIGYHVTNSCDKARIINCGSQGHSTAGIQIDAGCTNVVVRQFDSGGGDGHFIDNGLLTYLDIKEKDSREYHEHTYPFPNGEGTAGDSVAVQSQINDETGATNVKDYFGDAALLVPPATITSDWFLKGINIFATTANDDQRFLGYRIVNRITATRNGGNAWDEGATVLTVQDAAEAALFEVNDLVWISSPNYKPDGEIVKITDITGANITIARQTESSGRTGLHWNHTTNDGGNEVMHLCWRDELEYHSSDWDYSASGARDFNSYRFQDERRMHSSDGFVVRMINGTDNANSQASVTIIWSD